MDDLELDIGFQFKGLPTAQEYLATLEAIIDAENESVKAFKKSADAVEEELMAREEALKKPSYGAPGPYQRLSRTAEQLRTARSEGAGESVIADLDLRFKTLVGQIERIAIRERPKLPTVQEALGAMDGPSNPFDLPGLKPGRPTPPEPTEAKRLAEALISTRFGGAVSPLLGRSAAALGVEGPTKVLTQGLEKVFPALTARAGTGIMSKLGPLALVSAATATALGALKDGTDELVERFNAAADEVSASTRRLSDFRDISGATIGEGAALQQVGVSPSDARGLLQRITTDPVAMGAASSLGVSAVPGPYGTLNAGQKTMEVIEGLRRVRDEEQRLRLARQMGAEGLLHATRITEESWQKLKESAKLSQSVFDASQQTRAAEHQASRQRFGEAQERMLSNFLAPVMDIGTHLRNNATDSMDEFTKFLDRLDKQGEGAAYGGVDWKKLLSPFWIRQESGESPNRRQDRDPVSANTEALAQNTEAMARLNRTIGGGARSGRALPGALQGQNLAAAMNSGDLRFGPL